MGGGGGIYLTQLFTAVYCGRSRSEMCSWMCFHNDLWKFFKVIYFTQVRNSSKAVQKIRSLLTKYFHLLMTFCLFGKVY